MNEPRILEELRNHRYRLQKEDKEKIKSIIRGGWTECFKQGVIEESKTYQEVFGS